MFALDTIQFVNPSKKEARVDCSKEVQKMRSRYFQKHCDNWYCVVSGVEWWICTAVDSMDVSRWAHPKKVLRVRSTTMQMVACFFENKTGHVATVLLEQGRTVNSECYTIIGWVLNFLLRDVFGCFHLFVPLILRLVMMD